MQIDIWSDIVCPFCYIGKANLDAALGQAGVAADIHHKAFRLQPGQPPMLVDDMLARKYGLTGAAAAAQQMRITDMAAQAGLDFRLGGTRIGDTLDGHRLIKFAATQGLEAAMLERLYRAYFTEHSDVLDRDSLIDLGEEIGLDRAAISDMLASDVFAAEVDTDQRFAASLNVQGVPFFVIDRKYAVSGAQPVAAFLQAIQAAGPAAKDGDACAVLGCD